MNENILGIDAGTNSLGMALRNILLGENLIDQLEYLSVDIFDAGTNSGISHAAERTQHRQPRRLYDTRRQKLWATLQLLIDYKLCPMKQESLDQWKTYDKKRNLFRKYPIEDVALDKWIKLDFDGNGIQDYSSPYQLRKELVEKQYDFSNDIDRYKLGRALYHIAQHRGFKSSKGETFSGEKEKEKEKEKNLIDISEEGIIQSMEKSEMKISKDLEALRQAKKFKTAGQTLAYLEEHGTRIRGGIYKPIRSMLMSEIREIFEFQSELATSSELFRRLISTKKGDGTIFYKKPLKSQRGSIGKCTLEPQKARCPIGHPEFEKFRAWSLLNNIHYRTSPNEDWQELSFELKQEILQKLFLARVKVDFSFEEIRVFIEKKIGHILTGKGNKRLINYRDEQSISSCPVTARMIKIFGENWNEWEMAGNKERCSHSNKSLSHQVKYDAMDIWHVCLNADDKESIKEFAQNRLNWDDKQSKLLVQLWGAIPQGYAMLSLKAIKRINKMLLRGLKYSDAVLMAKLPDIIGENETEEFISTHLQTIRGFVNHEKIINQIANSLIANYKSLPEKYIFAYNDFNYKLDNSDKKEIEKQVIGFFGKEKWALMTFEEQQPIIVDVTQKYQNFFNDLKRKFYTSTPLLEKIKEKLKELYPEIQDKALDSIYHHSQISLYNVDRKSTDKSQSRLKSPNIGSIKNPTILRALHILKRKINAMLDAGLISTEYTRIVVELSRQLNDANRKWAFNFYQEERKKEREKAKEILSEYYPNRAINELDIDKALYIIDQKEDIQLTNGKGETYKQKKDQEKILKKYKVWLEQGCQCMYTGKIINLTNLFDDNAFDLEHTIPRSLSFDNSDKNLTVCDAHYNRTIKKNQLPTQLPNYEHDAEIGGTIYKAIKPRLKHWEERVKHISKNIEIWKSKSRYAQDKERKDSCIQQRRLWELELDYWKEKLRRFTMTEVPEGFRNSQLVDTSIIAKYTTLYLKSIFNKVEVNVGVTTSDFKKILGLQHIEETKNRDLHSHHAIDAAVLTTIPIAAKRQRMLELFYQIQEAKVGFHDCYEKEKELKDELNACRIGNKNNEIVEYINSNLLINHKKKDNTFIPARKRIKMRGNNKNNKEVERWATGDAVRGRLHNTTFCGAIHLPQGKDKDGKFVYGQKPNDFTIVSRVNVNSKSFSSKKDLEKIIDPSLKAMISTILEKRIATGCGFKKAIDEDMWMLDQNGNEIKQDRNGRPLSPIRHVRCKVKMGRGFMTFEKSLEIKKHLNLSKKALINLDNRDHKKLLYAVNDTNYMLLLYEGEKKGVIVRKSRIINLLDAVNIKKEYSSSNLELTLKQNKQFSEIIDKGVSYHLKYLLKTGIRVLLWKESPQEIYASKKDIKELSRKLFIVKNFNNQRSDYVYLSHHLNAKNGDKGIDERFVPNEMNFLVEHVDFEIDDLGNIKFYD